MDAFYIAQDDNVFQPTDRTIGPWDDRSQHGGPPSALLGRAVELAPGSDGKQVGRIAFEIVRPVPLDPLEVTAEVVRPGKRVDLVEATLSAGGQPVMLARAWRLRTTDTDTGYEPSVEQPPSPQEGYRTPTFRPPTTVNYLTSIDWIFVAGEFTKPGPATAWMRMLHPLVDGEEPSPLSRVLIAADSASGISSVVDPRSWLFVNVDYTVNLHRHPTGEWVCLDAATVPGRSGIGLTTSTLFDEKGPLGSTSQTLLVEPR